MDRRLCSRKSTTLQKYMTRKTNNNKSPILFRITLLKFFTDKPLQDSYTNGKFRPEDDYIIRQVDLYNIAWEAESNPSLLDHPKAYCDPVTIEQKDSLSLNRALAGIFPEAKQRVRLNC